MRKRYNQHYYQTDSVYYSVKYNLYCEYSSRKGRFIWRYRLVDLKSKDETIFYHLGKAKSYIKNTYGKDIVGTMKNFLTGDDIKLTKGFL